MTTPLIEPLNSCDPRPAAAGGQPPRGPEGPPKRAMQAFEALFHASAPLNQHISAGCRGCPECVSLWSAYRDARTRYDHTIKELLG